MHQDAGVAIVVQPEVQIVMDPVEILDGRAPPEKVRRRRLVDVLGQFVALVHVLVVNLGFVAQAVGVGPFVAPPDLLRFHVEEVVKQCGHRQDSLIPKVSGGWLTRG